MKRELKFESPPELVRFDDGSWAVEIQVCKLELVPLILELQLLIARLTENFWIKSSKDRLSLKFGLEVKNKNTCFEQKKGFEFLLCSGSLSFLSSCLLQYYRDEGWNGVNHLDIEVESPGLGRYCTLVIKPVKPA
jgi:hypothetical protein